MTYTWYKIFNVDEFEALNLVSKNYELILTGVGLKEILVTKGFGYSMLYDDIFLPLNLNSRNPYYFDEHAIYVDEDNNVYLGIGEHDED